MKLIKKNLYKTLLTLSFFAPAISLAAADCPPGKICNPLGGETDTVPEFIKVLLDGVLLVGLPVVTLAVIYCGFLFVAARGNSEKLGKAKDALLYTLIGAAILLGSWSIAQLISETVQKL